VQNDQNGNKVQFPLDPAGHKSEYSVVLADLDERTVLAVSEWSKKVKEATKICDGV
jgi:hypothetical protein